MKQTYMFLPATFAVLTLAACQSDPDAAMPPGNGDCGAKKMAHLVGQPVSAFEALGHMGPVRIIRPGEAVTMDYRADRLNVVLDDQDVITDLNCS